MAVQTCSDTASAPPPHLLASCMHSDDGVPRADCHCGCGLFAGLEPAATSSAAQATAVAASTTPSTRICSCPPLSRTEEMDVAAAAPMAAGARDCPCIKRAWVLQLDARLAQVRPCEPLPEAHCDDTREVLISTTGFCAVNTSDRRQHIDPQQLGFAAFLPPHSAYILGDVRRMRAALRPTEKYSLIVMDPPWSNGSARRGHKYDVLDHDDLQSMPVPLLLAPGGLVALWVTNNARHLQAAEEDLLPQWGLRLEARWHWLKVTTSGEPLTPLESNHRKPYEVLLLARACGGAAAAAATATATADVWPVPSDRVLVTTTTVFHSEKPPLLHLLQPHLPASSGPLWQTCLDIFGRRPRPGVTTLGNEAIKLVATPLYHSLRRDCSFTSVREYN